jgi:hypothetical protein
MVEPVAHNDVTIEPVEQDASAALGCSAIECPVYVQVGRHRRLAHHVEHSFDLGERSFQVTADVVSLNAVKTRHGLHVGALVNESSSGLVQGWKNRGERPKRQTVAG